jgi:gamma-glutamylcyclotransferase (GGCT)/AIG2-like uncharacterized protein YtfP
MSHITLFFYGSLKRGCKNNHLLDEQEFICKARTLPLYKIVDLGHYGGLVKAEADGVAVNGELWNVNEECLAILDRFEMDEAEFHRSSVEIEGVASVESYFYTGSVSPSARTGDEWPLR